MGIVRFTLEGDEAKAVQAMLKVIDKQRIAERKFKDMGRAARGARDQTERVGESAGRMGQRSDSAIGGMKRGFMTLIAPIASVGAGVALVTKALRDMNAERERGATALKGMGEGFKRLVQISGGRPEELQALTSLTTSIARGEGIAPAEAAQLVFTGRSLGFSVGELRKMAPIQRIANLQSMVRGVGKFQQAFGADAGTPMAIFNKALVAAERSDIDVDALLTAAIQPAAAFARIGESDEQLLAAMSVLSGPGGKEPEIVATQIRSLATAFAKAPEQFKGLGFFGAFEKARAMPEELRRELIMGRVEAASAYTLMDKMWPVLQKRLGDIQAAEAATGTIGSAFRRTLGVVEGDPVMMALFRNRKAQVGQQLAEMGILGPSRLATEAERARMREISIEAGEDPFTRWGRGAAGAVTEFFGGDEDDVRTAQAGAPGIFGPLQLLRQWATGGDDTRSRVTRRLLQKEDENADKLGRAADKLSEATDRMGAPNPNAGDLD